MEEKIAGAGREVLVEMVKLAQKQRREGSQGSWKEFLNFYDKKFGASLSDPSRRATETLVAFLRTFSQEDDLKFFDKVMQCHSNHDAAKQVNKTSPDTESPEQRLVGLTLGHPQYPLDYSFPSHEQEWLVTKRSTKSKAMRSTAMVAVDCEMVLCEDGTEALVRICVVDRDLQVKLNTLVNPNKKVADYRTDITGICAKDLDGVTCSLPDIQRSMKRLLSHGTILVGHSLYNDMRALKVDHARVIDTSFVFKYGDGADYRRPSLNNLCKSVLGLEVRKNGAPHNCVDDACAAMKLVLAKIECGLDDVIPVVHESVHKSEMAKLLLHKIPINMHSEELHNIIPGNFAIEIKCTKKSRGGEETYSALAIFKNKREANQAFDSISGNQDKDSSDRPQKLISFELSAGVTGSLYVRKMAHDNLTSQPSSAKRQLEIETSGESKKLKTDHLNGELEESNKAESHQCDDHIKEIKRLKRELSQREKEISILNKIVSSLTRKQGL